MSLDALVHDVLRWCTVSGVGALVLACLAWSVDRATGDSRPALAAALWWAVLVRLVLPADVGSPFGARLPPDVAGAITSCGGGYDWYGNFDAHGVGVAMAIVWSSGSMLALYDLVRRLVHERRAWRRLDRRAPAPSTIALFHDVATRLRVRRRPRLVLSEREGPALVGLARPFIVVPAFLERRDQVAGLESVIAHELAHHVRRDGWRRLVALVVRAVFWFHPAAWWSARRLADLAELDCDRRAARVTSGGSTACRSALLNEVRRWSQFEAQPVTGLARPFVHPTSVVLARLRALELPLRRDTRFAAPLFIATFVFVAPALPPRDVVPPLTSLPGCLQQRHAVMAMYAQALADGQLEQLLTSTLDPKTSP